MMWLVYGIDGELLAEYRQNFAASAPTVEYGYRGGEQLITARADETRWHIRDDVGTGRIALDQTGSLANVRRNDYLPFGEELTGGVAGRTAARGYAPTNINQKFTGHERDASTGYDHTLWRKLDSVQGRWTLPDLSAQRWRKYRELWSESILSIVLVVEQNEMFRALTSEAEYNVMGRTMQTNNPSSFVQVPFIIQQFNRTF